MSKLLKRLGLFIIVLTLLAGCGAGAHAVRQGQLRDTIFSIEPKQNGSYFLWMTHDDVGVYCTLDANLFAKAKKIFEDPTRSPEVFLTYGSLNVGTPENPTINPGNTQGCQYEGATIYVISDVQAVSQ